METPVQASESTPTPNLNEFIVPGGTFKYNGFDFFKPKPNPVTGSFTAASLIEVMLLALCASEDPNIKALLTAAEIEMRDVQNNLFFPRP